MSFAIDVQALRERAATRAAAAANPAKRLTAGDDVSQLATEAASHCRKAVRTEGNLRMTREQADRCHAGGWDDAEIEAFIARRDRLLRWGYGEQDADDLAERLTLRDRELDDRRTCVECRHGRARRCPDGEPLPGAVLHRCGGFDEEAR